MEQGTVLILDDEEVVRLNLGAYFQDEGFLVHSAANAEKALEMLDTCKPDFAVVDMRLPGMSGDDFIRAALQQIPTLRCVVYTASTEYELPHDLQKVGMSSGDVFIKPVVEMNRFIGRLAARSKM